MKVLVVVDHAVGISGPHRNVVGTLNALTARDDVEVVLVTGNIDSEEPYARSPNLRLVLGFEPHNPKKVLSNIRHVLQSAKNCDVVYVPSGLKAMLYAQFSRWRKPLVVGPNVTPLPVVNRLHDSPGFLELRFLSDVWFENSRVRQAHVMRQTERADIPYVHHSIDMEKFSPKHKSKHWKERVGIKPETPVVLYVGRDTEPLKGVNELIDAVERAQQQVGFHLVVAGRMSGETAQRVEGLPGGGVILGFLTGDELSRAFASADVFVMPSSWESFGFTTLEAMSSGIAVIASNGGATPEIVIDRESGLVVDIVGEDGLHREDAAETLATAIEKLIRDPDLRDELGRNARRRVETHFSEERLGDDLVGLFQKAIDEH